MKKILTILVIFFSFGALTSFAITNDDVVLFQNDAELWGLKDQNGETLIEPTYKKMIRIGYHSWLVQAQDNKFGLTDEVGGVIIEPQYRHCDRILGKYAKLGNSSDFGLYNEYGELIIPHEYSKIDMLFGRMFLTYKNYKYGVVAFDGQPILKNEYDDIYMPSRNVMRLLYKGEWYEIEGVNVETLTLNDEIVNNIYESEDVNFYKIIKETGAVSGYSVLTLTDYIIKIFSSISPAHEETIDELMLSHGADTITILKKLTWIPKYPITYAEKYYKIMRNPNSGPLTDFKNTLRRKMN